MASLSTNNIKPKETIMLNFDLAAKITDKLKAIPTKRIKLYIEQHTVNYFKYGLNLLYVSKHHSPSETISIK